jgi:hypothetical protein
MREDEVVTRAPSSARLPLRVLVKGASTVVFTSWMGGPRSDLTYPRVIEAELLAAGHPNEVQVTAFPAERLKRAFRGYQRDVLPWSPDVVVLHYGHADSIHLFLPRWLERHVNSMGKRPGRLRTAYRKGLLRPTWIAIAKGQTRLDRWFGDALSSRRSRHFARDLEALIRHVRQVSSPLILVPELHPMGQQYRAWFPGVEGRMERLNARVAEMVGGLGLDDVRVVRIREMAGPLLERSPDVKADGSHYTPELHRAVGRTLAAQIAAWAVDQPHLELPAG